MRGFMIELVLSSAIVVPVAASLTQEEKKKSNPGDLAVFAIPKGTVYHKSPKCVTLRKSKVINEITLAEATKKEMSPCLQCNPPTLDELQVGLKPLELDTSYFDKIPGLKLKSVSQSTIATSSGVKSLRLTFLFEFSMHLQPADIKQSREVFASPAKFTLVAMDKHSVVLTPKKSTAGNHIIEGEMTGVKGDVFRIRVAVDDYGGKAKKLVVRKAITDQKEKN